MRSDLVRRAQGGDGEAFETLIRAAYDRLFAVADRILGDRYAAEDAVQEAVVRSWRDIRGLRDPDRFEAWLYRLVVNASRDHSRRRRRALHDGGVLPPDLQATGDDYARLVEHEALEGAFLTLSADHRIVLLLAALRRLLRAGDRHDPRRSHRHRLFAPALRHARDARCARAHARAKRSGHHDGGTAMTTHDDSRITDWLAGGEGHGRAAALDAALAAARSTSQRPAWVVSLTGGTFAEPRGTVLLRRGMVALVAGLLVGGLLVGGLAAGGVLPLHLPQQPVPSAAAIAPSATVGPSSVRPDGSPSAAPSSSPPTGLVAYLVVDCTPTVGIARCTSHPWLAAADGRDAHVLEGTNVVGWSADGSRLLLENVNDVGGAVSLLLADPTGTVVATIEVPCVVPPSDDKNIGGAGNPGHQCPDQGGFALSPDGTRVAFTRSDPNVDNSSVVSVLDLATGQSTMLTATRTTNPTGGRSATRAPGPAPARGSTAAPAGRRTAGASPSSGS